nr:GNAT family N-acetyltransferase [Paenibacillus alkalitolerans]
MITIREAEERDVPRLLDIYNHAVLHSTATFDLEEQTLEQRLEWFRKFGPRHPIIVAETMGEVAGYSCLTEFRAKPAYSQTAELSVYLHPSWQGKGIGKTLLGEIVQRGRQLGYHVLIAGITGGNEQSVKLHERFGFQLAGTFKEVGYKFGAWQHVEFYQLILEAE